MSDYKERMTKSYENFKRQIASIRTGRANPDLLNRIQVEYYGSVVPLQQVASVSVPEPMLLMLTVFDRGAVDAVDRAIQKSDLGLNPQKEGAIIRLRLPELTEERRRSLVKVVQKEAEEAKVAIRNVRRDAIDFVKASEKSKDISEDDAKREQETIQKSTDDFISKIDAAVKSKEQEILKV